MKRRNLYCRVSLISVAIGGALVTASCAVPQTGMGEVASSLPLEASRAASPNRDEIDELLISRGNAGVIHGSGPSVGDVFFEYFPGNRPVYLDGWIYEGGGYWGDPTALECCILRFRKDDAFRMVLTEWVTKPGTGQHATVRIVAAETLEMLPGEVFNGLGCAYQGHASLIAAIDQNRHTIRAVFWRNGRFHLNEWTYQMNSGCPSEEHEVE